MSVRTIGTLCAVAALLVCASLSHAALTGQISLTGNLPDTASVLPGTGVVVTVGLTQSGGVEKGLSRIQLNWSDSSPELNLASAVWIWDAATNSIASIDDADMAEMIVNRQGGAASGVTAGSFTVGTLAFNAPAQAGTYNLLLTGGSLDGDPTVTILIDDLSQGGYAFNGHNLSLDSYSFTVVPEPVSLVLLGLGSMGLLLKRGRKA